MFTIEIILDVIRKVAMSKHNILCSRKHSFINAYFLADTFYMQNYIENKRIKKLFLSIQTLFAHYN